MIKEAMKTTEQQSDAVSTIAGDWYYIQIRFKVAAGVDVKRLLRLLRNGKNSIANMSARWWWARWINNGFALLFRCGEYDTIHLYITSRRSNMNSFIRHLRIRTFRLTKHVPETKWERISGPKNDDEMKDIIDGLLESEGGDYIPTDIKLYKFGALYNEKTKQIKNERPLKSA